jgi:hypothetical protein
LTPGGPDPCQRLWRHWCEVSPARAGGGWTAWHGSRPAGYVHRRPCPAVPVTPTRLAQVRAAAAARGVSLAAILVTVGVVVLTYLAGKLIYRLRDVILLMVVGGFIALILNPFVLFVQRRIPRRGTAVAIITVWADAPRLRACQALSMVHG